MRVAALADLHGRLDGVVVPPCDLVVIAGDLSPYGWKEAPNQVPWLELVFAPWLERIAADAGAPVVGSSYASISSSAWQSSTARCA